MVPKRGLLPWVLGFSANADSRCVALILTSAETPLLTALLSLKQRSRPAPWGDPDRPTALPALGYSLLLLFVCECFAQLLLLLLWQIGRDDLEVVGLQLVDHLVDRRRATGEGKQRRGALRDLFAHLLDEVVANAYVGQSTRHPAHTGPDRSS